MIRIYYKEVNGDCSYEQSLAMYNSLTPERQEKIKKLRSAGVARKRIEIGYFLQQVLSRELKVPMDCIAYSYGENGKPTLDFKTLGRNLQKKGLPLERTGLYFNMSHSGKYVVIAVSDVDVGIDVEHKAKNYRQVAKRFFCEEEYRSICACPDETEQKQCFLEIWTKKEAYIKLTGLGMHSSTGNDSKPDDSVNLVSETTSGNNLGILILCAFAGAVLIGVIIYIIYKKGRKGTRL